MEYLDRPAARDARTLITQLQQRVQGQIDGDQVLPDDGLSLLALLERVLEGVSVRNAPPASRGPAPGAVAARQNARGPAPRCAPPPARSCARAEIEAFIDRVQALVDGGVLHAVDGQPLIEAAAQVRVCLPSAGT